MTRRSDERSKLELRALREIVGLSQADMAEALGVNRTTVKRWERPDSDGYTPPDDAFELLDNLVAQQDATVSAALAEHGGDAAVTLPYYRTQEELEAAGRPGLVGVANATTLAVAGELRRRGVDVRFGTGETLG